MILVSCLAVYSSRTYKFCIQISFKKTIMNINKYALNFLKLLMTGFLCYLSFFNSSEISGFIFLTVLIFHMLRLLIKANRGISKLKMTSYVKTIKYACLVAIILIELLKSINPKVLSDLLKYTG